MNGKAAGIVARDAAQNADCLRIDGGGGVVLPRGFAGRRERQLQSWKILGDIPDRFGVARALPKSVQVRMPVGGASGPEPQAGRQAIAASAKAARIRISMLEYMKRSPSSMKRRQLIKLAAFLGSHSRQAVLPIEAHHSFAAEYDASKAIRITGVISKVEWTNPHSYLYIDVKDDQGNLVTWTCEGGAPNTLSRRGFTKNDIKMGTPLPSTAMEPRTART
jgi:hypothetical protein